MTPPDQNKVGLPEELRAQFAGLEQRLWRAETLLGLCLGLSALLVSWLALFASDRLWDTPVGLRMAFTALGLAGAAFFGVQWLRLWVFQRRDLRAQAVLVQKRYRRLGDRLLGIVELAGEKQRPAYFSPALYRAAIDQVAAEARQFDFPAAVDRKPAKLAAITLGGLLALALVPILLSPAATLNALSRWAAPTRPIERFTLVSLEGFPREQIVAHGEDFEVAGGVRYRSLWKPSRAIWQFERQPKNVARTDGSRVQMRVPAQVETGSLTIKLGDTQAKVAIAPTHRPSLTELNAAIEWPAYLQHPANRQWVENGFLSVLEGSRVAFQGRATRALVTAQIRVGDQNGVPLQIENDQFSSEPLELDAVSELSFTWHDRYGLESAAPWRLQIRSQIDSPPMPELADLLKDTAILESEMLEIRTIGRDDFGVREIGVLWQLVADSSGTNAAPNRPFRFQAPTPQEKTLEDTFYFSPSLMGIPPDSVVELRGFATDYLPDRQPSLTPVYRVHILGNERHAELIRQNLESLLTHLEEVTRLEERVIEATRELLALPKDKLSAEENAERIAAAEEEQIRNAAGLEQLAREGTKTLREAVRNPTFSEETLREWAKNMQEMQGLADGKMQQAAESLKSARQSPESRSENLSQAAQKGQEILDALEELQRKVNQGLDDLQALTLAQRLRKIGADEKQIAGRLQKIVPEVIGMFPKELPPAYLNAEARLAADQEVAQQEIQTLHGEIGRFFERTQKENYGQVNDDMAESRVSEELHQIRDLIQENIAMNAVQNLGVWSERLEAWADLLEPKSDDSAGGDGGGEGASSDHALIKELIALLRVRDREINLRRRTSLLERQKTEVADYPASAQTLAATQEQVRQEMNRIQWENPVPALEFPLQDIIDAMEDVEGLLNKPQTDRQTEVAQIKAIELLSDVINLINEQQQKSNSQSSSRSPSAEEMAFLMQMMSLQNNPGQGVNPKGGGNTAGGTTDRAATPMPGDPNAKPGESRAVNRASGSTAPVPTEFREALENYFKAIENLDRK